MIKSLFFLALFSPALAAAGNACPSEFCDGLFITLPAGNYQRTIDYQRKSCNGQVNYRLKDNSRVGCLTGTHAIQYNFAKNWSDAIGQSLYYAFQTGKKAGIVLIFKQADAVQYYHRLMSVIAHNGLKIDVWVINSSAITN